MVVMEFPNIPLDQGKLLSKTIPSVAILSILCNLKKIVQPFK